MLYLLFINVFVNVVTNFNNNNNNNNSVSFIENVAVLADVSIDIDSDAARKRHMVDTHYSTFFTGITDHKDRTKRITINLGADYNVAMILIVNEISFLNELIDFKIAIGR
jgi:hypothetical protein